MRLEISLFPSLLPNPDSPHAKSPKKPKNFLQIASVPERRDAQHFPHPPPACLPRPAAPRSPRFPRRTRPPQVDAVPRANEESPAMTTPRRSHGFPARLAAIGLALAALASPIFSTRTLAAATPSTDPLLRRLATTQGLCVVLGESNCETALRLIRDTELTVYVQLPRADDVEAARRIADKRGVYGRRLFIDQGGLDHLHLADNLADALIATGDAAKLTDTEALRVLRPKGKALLGDRDILKPVPEGIDDWSHPYHGPDNNPASKDRVAQGPYLTQFLAEPRYAPLPQAAVAAGGRVFKLFGHIAFKEREEPWLNTLAAFNGYNGSLLWRREIPAGINVHRNTFIATSNVVYYGDDKSCKVLDAATGELRDEIAPAESITGGSFWKWMALDGGLLYATVGEQEQRDPVIRLKSDNHGWPWDPLSPAFNQPENPWGFGRTLLAIDPESKSVRWHHEEKEPFDGRATCVRSGRIFLFRHGSYLTCLDSSTGKELWRRTPQDSPDLFQALGPALPRQDWRTNWRTTSYTRASDQALYLAGPTISKLLAVSAIDGRLLWQHPYNNYQLVLQGDSLWALSGQIDAQPSRKFDALTGRVIQELSLARRACARPTGAFDAIFCRANGGSTRIDLATSQPQLVSPMRAQCQDGVTIANGLLYWWPSTCDCNLSLYGITSLGPAGNFNFAAAAKESERLEPGSQPIPATTPITPPDWPSFRADNSASSTVPTTLPAKVRQLWKSSPNSELTPTAPTIADGRAYVAGSDGVVRAFDVTNGSTLWTAFTGGTIRYSPTYWNGRVFVGSGDGWAYSFSASTGKLVWRFRAAPAERKIPVYGQILSTWPAASGVLVKDGVAYVAAGIVNYDGTHVYALDALTGRLKWQNNSSGHLDADSLAGVSVQGHMIIHDGKLWIAGGNVVSPGTYDLNDGRCLNDVGLVHRMSSGNLPSSESPRGSSLFIVGDSVRVSDQPLYAHPKWKVYDASVLNKSWLGSMGDRDITWVNNNRLVAYPRVEEKRSERFLAGWGKNRVPGLDPAWEVEIKDSTAVALARNAITVGSPSALTTYNLADGKVLWGQALPGTPVSWGLAIDRDGRVFVSLEGGQIICYGSPDSSNLRASIAK